MATYELPPVILTHIRDTSLVEDILPAGEILVPFFGKLPSTLPIYVYVFSRDILLSHDFDLEIGDEKEFVTYTESDSEVWESLIPEIESCLAKISKYCDDRYRSHGPGMKECMPEIRIKMKDDVYLTPGDFIGSKVFQDKDDLLCELFNYLGDIYIDQMPNLISNKEINEKVELPNIFISHISQFRIDSLWMEPSYETGIGIKNGFEQTQVFANYFSPWISEHYLNRNRYIYIFNIELLNEHNWYVNTTDQLGRFGGGTSFLPKDSPSYWKDFKHYIKMNSRDWFRRCNGESNYDNFRSRNRYRSAEIVVFGKVSLVNYLMGVIRIANVPPKFKKQTSPRFQEDDYDEEEFDEYVEILKDRCVYPIRSLYISNTENYTIVDLYCRVLETVQQWFQDQTNIQTQRITRNRTRRRVSASNRSPKGRIVRNRSHSR